MTSGLILGTEFDCEVGLGSNEEKISKRLSEKGAFCVRWSPVALWKTRLFIFVS